MIIKIHKFLKSDLSEQSNCIVHLNNTTGMTIDHYACSLKSSEATIPYIITGVDKHIPIIADEEFCIVVRKKVNLTATGPNEGVRKGIGEDIGKYKYTDNVPPRTLDLPSGFQELYKNK